MCIDLPDFGRSVQAKLKEARAARVARAFCWLRWGQPCVPPTRPVKVEATVTTPSLSFSPSEGSGRGAGPKSTSAPFLGSKIEPWQEQTNALRSVDHMFTGQPWCVHTAV